jgi:cell division transport system permease protein
MWRAILYSVQEGLLALWRTKAVSLLSIGTIAVSFTVMGVFLLVSVNVAALTEAYGEELVVHVFLSDGLSQQELAGVQRSIEQDERISSFGYVGKEDAAERFRRLFPDEGRLLDTLSGNPLPESFELTLREDLRTNPYQIQDLVSGLSEQRGVEAVRYDRHWVETLETAALWVSYVGLAIGGLLILAAIVTASNIIKINIYSRRDEIDIMRLVGAESVYVRGPFFVGGIVQGLLASVLSIVALFVLFNIGEGYLRVMKFGLLEKLSFRFLPLDYLLFFVIGGLLVGFLASLLSFRRAWRD